MMNRIILSCGFVLSLGTACVTYPVGDTELRSPQLCGESSCDPGTPGTVFRFVDKAYSPEVDELTTIQAVAYQVIGQTVDPYDRYPTDLDTCSKDAANPFPPEAIKNVKYVPPGHSIDYSKTVKLKFDVEAAVEADVKKLAGAALDAAKIESLKASYKAAYSKVNDTEVKLVGYYTEWRLSARVMDELQMGKSYQECAANLKEGKRALITGASIVYFESSFRQASLATLAQELEASLAKNGLEISLAISFKRTVEEKLNTESKLFQVVVWNKAVLINGAWLPVPSR